MSRSLSGLQAIILGSVVVAGLALGIAGLFAVGSRHWPWNEPFTVRTSFPRIAGVEAGSLLTLAGGVVEQAGVPQNVRKREV